MTTYRDSIIRKGLVLVAIPLVAQIVFLVTLVKIRQDQAEAQKWALHTGRVIAESERFYGALERAQSALRGYMLTADPVFADSFQQARAALPMKIDRLQELVADAPEQESQLRRVDTQLEAVLAWMSGLYMQARTKGRARAITEMTAQGGQREVAELRRLFEEFLREEERIKVERRDELVWQASLQNDVLYGGAALALLSTALLAVLFVRSIAGRLRTLAENVRRLGESKELLPPLTGADELSRLDRAFREMAAALAQKNEENETFVYSVSHDLRSPLVNLQGFGEELRFAADDLRRLLTESDGVPPVVRQRGLTLIDGAVGEAVGFIQTAVTRLAGIIDALLRLSRAGRVEYRWQEVDLAAAVARVVTALRGTIKAKKAEVVVGTLPPAWGDPTALEQVFANLIGNAVNYLDPTRPGKIEVGVEPKRRDGLRVFHVRDNGLGIAAAHQSKVFLAFQRLHPDAAPGEGIGLALVRRVVERHQGTIWLESKPGEGTTFYVALPDAKPFA